MNIREYGSAPEMPILPTPKPREVTVELGEGHLLITRSHRQRWIDICWQLLGMQIDIARRQSRGTGSTKFQ